MLLEKVQSEIDPSIRWCFPPLRFKNRWWVLPTLPLVNDVLGGTWSSLLQIEPAVKTQTTPQIEFDISVEVDPWKYEICETYSPVHVKTLQAQIAINSEVGGLEICWSGSPTLLWSWEAAYLANWRLEARHPLTATGTHWEYSNFCLSLGTHAYLGTLSSSKTPADCHWDPSSRGGHQGEPCIRNESRWWTAINSCREIGC